MTITEDKAREVLATQAPSDEFLQFARAMIDAGKFAAAETNELREFTYFLEKPWKWAAEFAAWDAAGRPQDGSEQGWEAFLVAVEA